MVRDRWGIPHIKAENQDDLFFAQGFVQAEDRLFQMDLWRRSVQGRLSEVLGSNFLERDAMTRRIQYRGSIDAEWAAYGADAKAIASAFVAGINAWIRMAHDPFPEEFVLAGWAPELWRAEDLLNRTDAFTASADAQDEVFRARLVAAVGRSTAGHLLPAAVPYVVPSGLDLTAISPIVGDLLRSVGTPPFLVSLARDVAQDFSPASGRVAQDFSPARTAGSNAWAIARSDGGSPLVAGDPHRPLENPSLRYLVHLQAPGWNVIGATAPWLPGVAIGHNEHVAWSLTAASADNQDLYVEKLNPANPRQIVDAGRWVDMVVEHDTIIVKGHDKPFEYDYSYTPHGVVVAIDRARQLAFVVRWSGFEPGAAAELGALAIDRAQSADDFRRALEQWKMPSAEFVYADRGGTIGRQLAALVPGRAGWTGRLPVPGHVKGYEWSGWTAFDRLASEKASARMFVVSANQSRARSSRIEERLSEPDSGSIEGFKELQHDVMSWNASRLVPLLASLRAGDPDVEDLRRRLLTWDRRITANTAEANAYIRWETALVRNLAARRVPAGLVDEYVARGGSMLVPALTNPSRVWFDATPARQRDELLLQSLAEAQDISREGESQRVVTFAHPLALTVQTRRRFNIGPFAMPGYGETVLAMSIPRSGRTSGPSLRVIFNPGEWDLSVATNAPGQSGSPDSPHFSDLAELWRMGEYFPLSFSEAAVEKNAHTTLTIVPR